MSTMAGLNHLANEWRELADQQAKTLEWCADRLEELPSCWCGGE